MSNIPPPPLTVLLEWLRNKNYDIGARDDAAMDLALHDVPEALEALSTAAQNSHEDEMVLKSAGESLGEIWTRNDNFNPVEYTKLVPVAKREAYDVIKRLRPDWIEKYQLQRK